MASIRRTLSPAYNDRHYNSPSHRLSSSKHQNYSLPSAIAAGIYRRGARRVLLRCCAFFLVGLLLGITPFERRSISDETSGAEISLPPPPPTPTAPEDDELAARFEVRLGEAELVFVPRKQIIVVTPTYGRAAQAYFLNRVGQALRLVPPPVVWIVVEMSPASMETAEVLRKTGVMYRHLVCSKNSTDVKDRGVHQRNTALDHIERHRLDGIVYFADDDNVYSLELFYALRNVSRFGTWPVAMLAPSKNKAILEGPICNGSQVIGWHTNEKSKRLRRFHVDMSGFAFNSTILWDPKRWRRPTTSPIRQLDTVKEGFQETTFIEQVVEDESQMEGTPDGCATVLNWHLHLRIRGANYPKGWMLQKNLEVDLPLID